MKNIIFIVDAQKGPSGGGKKIYEYAGYINTLKGYSSEVIHIFKKKSVKWKQSLKKLVKYNNKKHEATGWKFNEIAIKKNHKFHWFNSNIKIKNNFDIDNKKDFFVLPEIFAHFADDFLIQNKTPYAIFMQNPYAIFPTNDYKKLNRSYTKAQFILHYSKVMKRGILQAFPSAKKKLLEVGTSIDSSKLYFSKMKKLNIITYMPRKLPLHANLVLNYLKNYLPKEWVLKPINNLNEFETFKLLKKSKIFLSFSFLEGLGMPPLEAAIAGNKVIGYTGEGGKEYWKEPIFTEIHNSAIFDFCEKILKNLDNSNFLKKSSIQRKKIIQKYSVQNERIFIDNFLKKI